MKTISALFGTAPAAAGLAMILAVASFGKARADDDAVTRGARIAAFMARHDNPLPIDAKAQANSSGVPALSEHQSTLGPGFRLSPRATGTDGFYIATLTRT